METLWFKGDNYSSDIIILTRTGESYSAVLIKRGNEPFKGMYALPGGFLKSLTEKGSEFKPSETPIEAAKRELKEETGISGPDLNLELTGIYDDLERDPRAKPGQRVISNAFAAVIDKMADIKAGDDAKSVEWVSLGDIFSGKIKLAFDHYKIIKDAVLKLKLESGGLW